MRQIFVVRNGWGAATGGAFLTAAQMACFCNPLSPLRRNQWLFQSSSTPSQTKKTQDTQMYSKPKKSILGGYQVVDSTDPLKTHSLTTLPLDSNPLMGLRN